MPTDEKELNALIGQKVFAMRKLRRMSQLELGEAIGRTRSTISNIESGRFGTTTHTLTRLSEELNVSVAVLLGVDSTPLPIMYTGVVYRSVCSTCGIIGERDSQEAANAHSEAHCASHQV